MFTPLHVRFLHALHEQSYATTQVPVLPGSGLLKSEQEAGTLADGIGYPVLLKVTYPDCMTCPVRRSLCPILAPSGHTRRVKQLHDARSYAPPEVVVVAGRLGLR